MELLKLILFCTVYSVFNIGNFISFVLFYLLCVFVLNKENTMNNEPSSFLLNTLSLLLNLSILSGEVIIHKMKKNTYFNKIIELYNYMNSIYLQSWCKVKKFLCSRYSSKELKTQKDIDQFLNSIN
jgi:hypothetical protein